MKPKRDLLIGVTFLVLLAALAVGQKVLENRAVAEAAGVQAPMFEVDPLWPKPLPNHWLLGQHDRSFGRCAGSRLDHPSRRLARAQGSVRHCESAERSMLLAGAAGS